jgi:hypothetical protein
MFRVPESTVDRRVREVGHAARQTVGRPAPVLRCQPEEELDAERGPILPNRMLKRLSAELEASEKEANGEKEPAAR